MFDVESDFHREEHVKKYGTNSAHYPNKVVAKINAHHLIHYFCTKLPFPPKPRDWLNRGIYKRIDNGDYMLMYQSVIDRNDSILKFEKSTLNPAPTRANFVSLYKLERLPFDCCKVTYVAKADIKGSVPKIVAETGLSIVVDIPHRAYEFFERDKEVSVARVWLEGLREVAPSTFAKVELCFSRPPFFSFFENEH